MTKIQQFFKRIGMDPATKVELNKEFLGRVQTACVLNIAYENLDILEGKPIQLTEKVLFDKIVIRGRGGYCFELNGLLAYMLQEMGFSVTERFSRFLRGESAIPMRRHRVCVVMLPDGDYLCDIGVGQIAPRLPLKLEAGLIQEQNGEVYQFTKDPRHGWVLNDLHHGTWRQFICFTDEAVYPVDFEQPSFYCEAHPASIFNIEPIIAIKTESGRQTIDGHTYKVFQGDELVHIEENISEDRMTALLQNEFKLTPKGE